MNQSQYNRIDPNRYPYNFQTTENLPERQRKCTDCFCILLFLLCFAAGIGVAGYGISQGDPSKIVQPFDSAGNACGIGNLKDYPFLFFNDPENSVKDSSACVKECPKNNGDQVQCYPNGKIQA